MLTVSLKNTEFKKKAITFRVGKCDADKKRMILVTFKNIWKTQKCISAAMRHQISNRRKILILTELSPAEKIFERKLLKKRYGLISDGVDKSLLSIKNLKLYQNGQVNCS